MTFHSNSEEIRYYIKQLLDQGEEKTTQEIIRYVKEVSGKDFTGGMLAGAINDFIDREHAYQRIRRGVYAKVPAQEQEDPFDLILRNAIEAVENARRIDIERLDPARLLRMQEKSRRILTGLNRLLEG